MVEARKRDMPKDAGRPVTEDYGDADSRDRRSGLVAPECVDREGHDWNSGIVSHKAMRGQEILSAYPLDRSSYVGPEVEERGRKLAGSPDDLSHSLSGATAAPETQPDKRGRKDTVIYP